MASGLTKKLVTMRIDCDIAAAHAGDSVYVTGDKEKIIGTITSGAYGHRVEKNIAYAFVNPALAELGTG